MTALAPFYVLISGLISAIVNAFALGSAQERASTFEIQLVMNCMLTAAALGLISQLSKITGDESKNKMTSENTKQRDLVSQESTQDNFLFLNQEIDTRSSMTEVVLEKLSHGIAITRDFYNSEIVEDDISEEDSSEEELDH